MIDHIGIAVSDLERSKAFYSRALAPIGYRLLLELPASVTGNAAIAGFGAPPKPDFWIAQGTPNSPPVHVAFRVPERALVEAFYREATAAGGRDNGAPGLRPHYHPDYYGAFVLDPDGHNVEVVCHARPGAPTLRTAVPVLASLDIGESVDFYTRGLGFAVRYRGDDYLIVDRDGAELHFWLCQDRHIAENTSCYLRVRGIDAMHEDFSSRGVSLAPPAVRPWGMKEMHLLDPHGNLLKFGEAA